MTPGILRRISSIPQKQPPARMAVSVVARAALASCASDGWSAAIAVGGEGPNAITTSEAIVARPTTAPRGGAWRSPWFMARASRRVRCPTRAPEATEVRGDPACSGCLRGDGRSRGPIAPPRDRRLRIPDLVSRAIRSLAFVLVCLASLELGARLFWRARGVPFMRPDRVLQAFYPGLAKIDARNPKWAAGRMHVLLLGGSTLHPHWGTVQEELREQLAYAGHRDVRIFNLAAPGLTSRDSRLAYEAVGAEHFDRVVVYAGINEARANNVPPDIC